MLTRLPCLWSGGALGTYTACSSLPRYLVLPCMPASSCSKRRTDLFIGSARNSLPFGTSRHTACKTRGSSCHHLLREVCAATNHLRLASLATTHARHARTHALTGDTDVLSPQHVPNSLLFDVNESFALRLRLNACVVLADSATWKRRGKARRFPATVDPVRHTSRTRMDSSPVAKSATVPMLKLSPKPPSKHVCPVAVYFPSH